MQHLPMFIHKMLSTMSSSHLDILVSWFFSLSFSFLSSSIWINWIINFFLSSSNRFTLLHRVIIFSSYCILSFLTVTTSSRGLDFNTTLRLSIRSFNSALLYKVALDTSTSFATISKLIFFLVRFNLSIALLTLSIVSSFFCSACAFIPATYSSVNFCFFLFELSYFSTCTISSIYKNNENHFY